MAAGADVPGLIEAGIDTFSARAAARFVLTFATQSFPVDVLGDPDARLELTDSRSGDLLLTGRADSITTDRISGTTTIEGRDLAALLIDQTLAETFANRTSGEIASSLAGRHGLSADVTATSTPAGRFFQSDRSLLGIATEWDLLATLADAESFDLYVAGETLTFARPEPQGAIALTLADCISLEQTRAAAIERAVELTVRSYDPAAARAITRTASRGKGTPRRQHVTRPNLTDNEAEQLVARVLADLARFERTASLSMPGESSIDIRSTIEIDGDSYAVASLHREWGRGGFTQSLFLTAAP